MDPEEGSEVVLFSVSGDNIVCSFGGGIYEKGE
jgi:hypothetical protein